MEFTYSLEKLKYNKEANCGREYRQCTLSVMDTIADPYIKFDEKGICNYYYEYIKAESLHTKKDAEGIEYQKKLAQRIKNLNSSNKYDCIIGLSGGADSTFLVYKAKLLGLNSLLVHFDYGWNSEIAIKNVENAAQKSGFDLYTVVMNWEEFKSLQRSYFKASVLDLDVPADHMILGALFKVANKFNIKFILSGNNIWTEHTLPPSWNYNKFDLINIKNIHKKFENTSLKHLPKLGFIESILYQKYYKIEQIQLLNYEYYEKKKVIEIIKKELGWIDYGGKHNESVFTRFYQGFILPVKFNIDKRKAHLSNLIYSDQLTKEEALNELNNPPYPIELMKADFEYVAKKLDFKIHEFERILKQPNISHDFYGTDKQLRNIYFKILNLTKSFR